ncbi:MAG: SurA N-terminal domain-containing protein [Dysgonamonadaceae bacterium]|jgi:peptidyl-prolyl cis-trans isomerase D|nr:SurA N-terminal domain-containing protein [Dysgonamonadaceae bacterium]
MAALEKIRNKAGLLVGVVGVALVAFVVGDGLRSGSTYFNQSKNKVLTVDGQSVDIRDFQQRIEAVSSQYRAGGSLTEEQSAQIRESIFEEMVAKILLDNEADKVGFTVGEDEIRDLLIGDNIAPQIQQYFANPQTGRFDRTQYLTYVQQIESTNISDLPSEQRENFVRLQQQWEDMKENVILQKKLSKFAALLSASLAPNALDAKAAYDESSENVDFNYVLQPFSTIPDSTVEVSNAEIEQLYRERLKSFKQERAQIVNYIAVPVNPSDSDFKTVEDLILKGKAEFTEEGNVAEIISEYSDEKQFVDAFVSFNELDENQRVFVQNATIGSIEGPVLNNKTYSVYKLLATKTAPDSIKVNMLNLPNGEAARTEKLTDSLLNVLKSTPFAEVSKNSSNGQSDGNIGWQTEVSLAKGLDAKFAESLFDAELNKVFVLRSSYGSHIVQITEKTKPVQKYKIASIVVTVTPSQETNNKIYNNLSRYLISNRNLETFKSAAADAGYYVRTNVQFTPNQPLIAPINNSRQVIKWAYEHKKGDISEIFECEENYVIAAVEGSQKEGFAPVSEVSEALKREIINRKKGELLVDKFKALNAASLDAYAAGLNVKVDTVKLLSFADSRIVGIGVEPTVSARASLAEVNQITEPFAGRNGVYVLQVTGKTPSAQTYNEETQKQQLVMRNRYRLMSLLQNNKLLKDHAKIEDNRIRFY